MPFAQEARRRSAGNTQTGNRHSTREDSFAHHFDVTLYYIARIYDIHMIPEVHNLQNAWQPRRKKLECKK